MNKIITTICLSIWVCLAGVLNAAEDPNAAQPENTQSADVEDAQQLELSMDPADELLLVLELEKQQQPAKKQLASKVEIAEPVESVTTAPDVKEPNEVPAPVLSLSQPQEKKEFRDLRKKLMLDQMQPVEELSEEQKADNLGQLIQQLRSLKTPPKITPEPEEPAPVEPAQQTPQPPEQPAPVVEEKPAPEVAEEVVQVEDALLKQLKDAKNVRKPLRLADVLYRQQYYEEAFKYYQITLETLSQEDTSNRQWVLFQMGNCARQTNPAKAIEVYTELISSFPNAKWTHIAMARRSILQWSQENDIDSLIAGGGQ